MNERKCKNCNRPYSLCLVSEYSAETDSMRPLVHIGDVSQKDYNDVVDKLHVAMTECRVHRELWHDESVRTLAFTERVLDVLQFDNTDDLWWRRSSEDAKSGHIKFFVKCSDTFYLASADLEEITPENIDLLEQTFADVIAVSKLGDCYASILWVARVRKQKPLALWMERNLSDPELSGLRPLFDLVEAG